MDRKFKKNTYIIQIQKKAPKEKWGQETKQKNDEFKMAVNKNSQLCSGHETKAVTHKKMLNVKCVDKLYE